MKHLKDKLVYISSPIEHNSGSIWKANFIDRIITQFQCKVYDPESDPKQQWAPMLKEARDRKDYKLMAEIADRFVRKDLGKVDRCDILIASLPYKVVTTGVHHEIINAWNLKKLVLLCCPDKGKEYISLWYYGFIHSEFMFSSWNEVIEFLGKIDKGEYYHRRVDLICDRI